MPSKRRPGTEILSLSIFPSVILARRLPIIAIALAAFAAMLATSGCPALMVPSLAYQGYKYEKKKDSGSTNGSSGTSQPASQPTASNSIE
jgi:hypothetical protein